MVRSLSGRKAAKIYFAYLFLSNNTYSRLIVLKFSQVIPQVPFQHISERSYNYTSVASWEYLSHILLFRNSAKLYFLSVKIPSYFCFLCSIQAWLFFSLLLQHTIPLFYFVINFFFCLSLINRNSISVYIKKKNIENKIRYRWMKLEF